MTALRLLNATILTPGRIVERAGLEIGGGRIVRVLEEGAAGDGKSLDLEGGYLLPGFIDTQVNGGGGVLFNDTPTVDAIAAIGSAHAAFGTTGFLPTLISDDFDVIDRGMRATEQAIEAGVPGVLGIHVEGPFINERRKGIHDPAKFRRLDEEGIGLLTSLKRGRTLVTLAPEMCADADIARLAAAGVVVAAGHTDADYAATRSAMDAGVSGFTHLFNAMSPMRHRAPGVAGAALESQDAICGIIVDGHHVDPVVLRIALRSRPIGSFMLVSDAMPTVGSSTKQFRLGTREIRVVDGVCVGPDGTLAGSDLDMSAAVRNSVTMLGVGIDDAAAMAATAPARFLGLSDTHGSIVPGARADLVWMDRDLAVRGVWIGGEQVGERRIAA